MVCLPGTSVSSIHAKPQCGHGTSGVSELRDLFMVPHCVAQMLGSGILRVGAVCIQGPWEQDRLVCDRGKKKGILFLKAKKLCKMGKS